MQILSSIVGPSYSPEPGRPEEFPAPFERWYILSVLIGSVGVLFAIRMLKQGFRAKTEQAVQ